jgi:hypothetical protein
MIGLSHQQADRCPYLDAWSHAGGERTGVGLPLRRPLSGLATVTVHVVNEDLVELFEQVLPHQDSGRIAEPTEIRNEADNPLIRLLGDSALSQSEESDVVIVELVLADPPRLTG